MTVASEAAMTISSLVDETMDLLHGYVRDQEQRTSLAAPIVATDVTFKVTNLNQIARGLVEIEDELVVVSAVDAATGTATIEPWGRGQSGTTAVAHAVGARVTMSPLYPRSRVAGALYGVLRELFPDVFAVAATTLNINPVRTNYALPADCYHVLAVEWALPGPTGMWVPAKRWRQNKTATAVELELLSAAWPGPNRGRVLYMRTPPTVVSGTDDLATYGYTTEIRDLIVLGAAARMMALTESARVQVQSVEARGGAEAVPAGSAQNLSRYLYQLFQRRLDDERRQLSVRYPLQPHRTR